MKLVPPRFLRLCFFLLTSLLFFCQFSLAQDSNPIRIGATISLEGKYQSVSFMVRKGYELWAEQINSRGGLLGRKVELLFYDDKKALDSILDELRESEEKYRILSENTLTLVLVLNAQGLQYANRASTIFFSLLPTDVPGKDIFTLFAEPDRIILQSHVEALEKAKSGVEHFELSYIPPNGEQRWLEVVASVIPYMGTSSILLHALDASQRKRMEIERQSMRRKIARGEQMEALGTLAGGVAHDLNNILSGVVSYPELLLHGMDKGDKLYSPLRTIHQSGLKAAAIVQDLLTLTRRGVVVTEVVNLGNIIREYLASPEFDHLYQEFPNIYVALQIDDRLMNIKGSYHHLSKSIMNLVTNSAEALPQGGDILITAQNIYVDSPFSSYDEINEGEYVAVSISDNGEGISTEDLDKIFEPFYTKKVMGRSGTGLGMSVVWGAVKDHQGYIDIDSKKGEGSTFTLYFPASRENLSESIAALTAQAPRGRGEKLLVVDDIEEQRLIAASMLEHLGYGVDVAESGEQALEILEHKQYAAILLDMIMEPGMDGLDTFQEILRRYPQQKAVIASGFSETERVRSALAMGAGAYIKKPYGLETLATTINEVLYRKNNAT